MLPIPITKRPESYKTLEEVEKLRTGDRRIRIEQFHGLNQPVKIVPTPDWMK